MSGKREFVAPGHQQCIDGNLPPETHSAKREPDAMKKGRAKGGKGDRQVTARAHKPAASRPRQCSAKRIQREDGAGQGGKGLLKCAKTS